MVEPGMKIRKMADHMTLGDLGLYKRLDEEFGMHRKVRLIVQEPDYDSGIWQLRFSIERSDGKAVTLSTEERLDDAMFDLLILKIRMMM